MEKRADNTFVGGLNTDRHPLASSKEELIEAFNIDLGAVGEGYQLILQKREGNSELLIYNPNTQLFESAGLPEGFIPLAVKEFNNIAYIISVNPGTGYGELGTFPSPDYDLFKFQQGTDPIPGAAVIGAPIYDPATEPPAFGFRVDPDAGVGTVYDVLVLSSKDDPLEEVLVHSKFNIVQLGYTPDSYTLALDDDLGGNINLWYNLNDGTGDHLYNPGDILTLNSPGDSIRVTANVRHIEDLWGNGATDPLDGFTYALTTTVTSVGGQPDQDVLFKFYCLWDPQVRIAGAVDTWNTNVIPPQYPVGGNDYNFDIRTNLDIPMTVLPVIYDGFCLPGWVTINVPAGPAFSIDAYPLAADALQITVAPNGCGSPRNATIRIDCGVPPDGVVKYMNIDISQAS